MWLAGELYTRRADLVLFVNGIPLVLMEFKGANLACVLPSSTTCATTVRQCRSSSRHAFVGLSDGSEAKMGATFAPWEHFGDWQKIDASGARGRVGLEILIRGTCHPDRLLDLVENFVAYTEVPGGVVKAVAGITSSSA